MNQSKFRGQNARTKENTVRLLLNIALVASLATPTILLTGCEGGNDEALGKVPLDISALINACAGVELPAEFSDAKFCVNHVDNGPKDVNATMSGWECIDMDLSSGEASNSFVDLLEPGDYYVAFSKEITDAGYGVNYTSGAFSVVGTMHMYRGVANSLSVVIGTDCTGGNPGNVNLVAVNSDGEAVPECGWNFSSDQLDLVCVVDDNGASCDNIAAGSYSVDVSCSDGSLTHEDFSFDVLAGLSSDYAVVVTPAGSSGSGLGWMCFTGDGQIVDLSECVVTANGFELTQGTPPDGETCDGIAVVDVPKGVTDFEIVCPDGSEDETTTEVKEDTKNEVHFNLVNPNAHLYGGVCFEVTGTTDPCTVDFTLISAANEPVVSVNPPTSCNGSGDYYYPGVPIGGRVVVVTCGTGNSTESFNVVPETDVHVVVVITTPTIGDMCLTKTGLPLGTNIPTVDMAPVVGYTTGGGCVAATPAELANISVAGFSGPNCVDQNDSNCAIQVNGMVVSMTDTFANLGYGVEELRVFPVQLVDLNQKTLNAPILTMYGIWL